MSDDVVVTIDVEWAHPEVLADTVGLLDERGIPATFFCTHEGIDVPGHERALHPNFRRSANSLMPRHESAILNDREFYRRIVAEARRFCPEAIGTRSHSLITDSDMMPVFRHEGLEYDSSCMLPLAPNLEPVWRGSGIVEIPVYYMDHWDLSENATGMSCARLGLERPGLKVLIFHPNLVFANARTRGDAARMKEHYHDTAWLLDNRNAGRGVRTLFIEVLDRIVSEDSRRMILAGVNAEWRAASDRPASRFGTMRSAGAL